jgi:hypothetical protein
MYGGQVFYHDIVRLAEMKDMWKERKPPLPLSYEQLIKTAEERCSDVGLKDHQVWSVLKCVDIFTQWYVFGCTLCLLLSFSDSSYQFEWAIKTTGNRVQVLRV